MIEVEQLTRYYQSFPALRNIDARIEDGEIVGFLGLNGAGKTTMLRVLAGLLPPSAGRVTIDGVDLERAPASFRRKIGFLPDEPPLYREMRVVDYLVWCGQLKGCSHAQARDNVTSVLRTCGIDHVAHAIIGELSFGYRKRVGIAQAIIHRPKLVILDEPIAGLDPVQIVEMRDVVRNLKAQSTVLVSSHILSEITQTCDRILVLHKGQLVATGTEHDLAKGGSEGTQLELSVRGAKNDVQATIDALPFVTAYSLSETPDGLAAAVTLREDERERLVAALVHANIGVRRVERAKSELETIFLQLTNDASRTARPRGAA